MEVALSGSQTWESQGSGAGGLVFNDPIDLGSHSLDVQTASGNSITLGTHNNDRISGSGGLSISGDGTLTLGSSSNTYAGGTTISGGIVVPHGDASFGTGSLVLSAGEIQSTADRTFANSINFAGNATLAGNSGIDYLFSTTSISGTGTLTVDNLSNSGTVTTLGFSGAGANITGNIVLADSVTQLRSTNSTGTQIFSGQISGAGSFIRQTSGGITLLSGANTHSGGTSVTSGTLQLGHNSAAGTGTLTLGSATLSASGGSRVLANAVTIAGNPIFGAGNDLEFSGPATLTGNRTLNVEANTTFSGSMGQSGGTRSLTKSGTGTLRLGGVNTFGGGVILSQGALLVGNNGALGGGSLSLSGGGIGAYGGNRNLPNSVSIAADSTFLAGDALTLSGNSILTGSRTLTVLNSTTFSGVISQSGGNRSLTKAGAGTLTLSGANTYSGTTTLNAGVLNAGHNSAFGTGSLALAGGTLGAVGGSRTLANTVSLAGNPTFAAGDAITFSGSATLTGNRTLNVLNTTTFDGVIGQSGGARGLTKSGSGTLVLTRVNTFSGGTTLTAGTLRGHHNQAFGTGMVTLAGGSLEGGNGPRNFANSIRIQANTTIGGASAVTFSGAVSNEGGDHVVNFTNSALTTMTGNVTLAESNAARTLTFDIDTASGGVALSGLIQPGTGTGTDTFVKSGGGELTLTASQSLVGMFVLGGGTLSLGGVNHQFDTLGVGADSVLSFGGLASILDLDHLSADPGTMLTVRNWTSGSDKIMVLHNPGAANLGRISFEGYGTGAMWVGNEIVPIPEPGSASIAALFLISLVLIRKRP